MLWEREKFVHGLGVTPQCKALIFCPGEEEGRAAFVSCWLYVLERFKLHLLKTRPAKCATVFAFLSWNLKKIQQKNYQNLPILKQMQIGWHYTQRIYSRKPFAVRPNRLGWSSQTYRIYLDFVTVADDEESVQLDV